MGSVKISETAFRVISRLAEEASAPVYQALMNVRSNPKVRIAMVMLKMVSEVRSLWRKAFLKSSLRMYIVQDTFIEITDRMRLLRRPRVVGHPANGFVCTKVELRHSHEHILSR